jgi:hypothetical protein
MANKKSSKKATPTPVVAATPALKTYRIPVTRIVELEVEVLEPNLEAAFEEVEQLISVGSLDWSKATPIEDTDEVDYVISQQRYPENNKNS